MREPKHKYISGDPWFICDVCGFRYRRSEMLRRWDNLIVCPQDWEPRHPQESVRATVDKLRVKNPRPEGEDTYITTAVTQDDL